MMVSHQPISPRLFTIWSLSPCTSCGSLLAQRTPGLLALLQRGQAHAQLRILGWYSLCPQIFPRETLCHPGTSVQMSPFQQTSLDSNLRSYYPALCITRPEILIICFCLSSYIRLSAFVCLGQQGNLSLWNNARHTADAQKYSLNKYRIHVKHRTRCFTAMRKALLLTLSTLTFNFPSIK